MATRLFEMQDIAPGRRNETNQWTVESQNSERREFSEKVHRDINRARVRLGVARTRYQVGTGEAIRDQAGNIVSGPSDGELVPPVSH